MARPYAGGVLSSMKAPAKHRARMASAIRCSFEHRLPLSAKCCTLVSPNVLYKISSPTLQPGPKPAQRIWRPQKAIIVDQIANNIGRRWATGIGSEPGLDRDASDSRADRQYPHSDECEVKVIDYSDTDVVTHEVNPSDIVSFLKDQPKPEWAACRWIYVNGLNQDVVRSLGDAKNLHRLALEDVMDVTTPTKVDWYDHHCFMEMPLQKLKYFRDDLQHRASGEISMSESGKSPHRSRTWRTLSEREFGMSVEQVSLFMTADNTIITIFQHSGPDVLKPILTRLNSPQTIVRSSNDPTMLVQAVIDVVVDLSIPIAKAVAETFSKLELAVLTAPTVGQSKQLYVLRSGLTLLADNTIAIGGLVRTLCDHHAVSVSFDQQSAASNKRPTQTPPPESIRMTPLTLTYLHDVQDHVTTLSNSTRMSIRSAENLTSLIFNTIAATQNESVRQLTLVSCFFLPLTFITGYCGMNFEVMPIVNDHSDAFFWLIATPVMLATSLLLLSTRGRSLRGLWRGSQRTHAERRER